MIDAETKRRVRGWVLQLLARTSPLDGELPFTPPDLMLSYLRNYGAGVVREDVERELGYLKGKGYVELKEFHGQMARIAGSAISARITASGVDVVDGTTLDRGVEIG